MKSFAQDLMFRGSILLPYVLKTLADNVSSSKCLIIAATESPVPILRSKFSQLVRFFKKKRSHLVTIVSRALQPQNGWIPCLVDRNLEIS